MTFFLSNGWFAWISGLLSLFIGLGTYGILGFAQVDAPARLDPHWAALAALTAVTVTFYVAFGILSMHWFAWRYWVYARLWNAVWFVAVITLDDTWFRLLGSLYAVLSLAVVWRFAPDRQLNSRLRTGRRE
jgi:hypothetical protein